MTSHLGGLLLGRVLAGRYRIAEVLGRGGMSVVYRATDQKLGRPVALKVVEHPSETEDAHRELRERFRREAAAAASIPPHPNVVQIYDYGTDPELDLDFIVMELLVGRDLKQAFASAPPRVEEALGILQSAALGLSAGHRAGIVHRDVKPANLFLSSHGGVSVVRVLDFGIAKPLDAAASSDLTRTGQHVYSPAYASPEQLRGERHVSPASDVYQLGLIGYELLAGERPFDAAERERIRAGERVPVPMRGHWRAIVPEVRGVIERALSTTPAERFADAGEMAGALAGAASGAGAHPSQSPGASAAPEPAPAAAPPPPASVPVAPGAAAVLRHLPRSWPGIAVGIAVLLLAVLLLRQDPSSAGESPVPAGSVPATAAAAEREPGGDQGVPADVADELRRSIAELNQSFAEGELRRHVDHYASRVDYYNSRRLARSRILRDRRRDAEHYPEREIRVHDVQLERIDAGRVRALVRKSWRLAGPERGERVGEGLQEYVFKLDDDDGKWYVVSEQLLEQTERHTPPPGVGAGS